PARGRGWTWQSAWMTSRTPWRGSSPEREPDEPHGERERMLWPHWSSLPIAVSVRAEFRTPRRHHRGRIEAAPRRDPQYWTVRRPGTSWRASTPRTWWGSGTGCCRRRPARPCTVPLPCIAARAAFCVRRGELGWTLRPAAVAAPAARQHGVARA